MQLPLFKPEPKMPAHYACSTASFRLRLASVVANDTTIPLDARLVALPSKRVQFPGIIIAGSRLLPNYGR